MAGLKEWVSSLPCLSPSLKRYPAGFLTLCHWHRLAPRWLPYGSLWVLLWAKFTLHEVVELLKRSHYTTCWHKLENFKVVVVYTLTGWAAGGTLEDPSPGTVPDQSLWSLPGKHTEAVTLQISQYQTPRLVLKKRNKPVSKGVHNCTSDALWTASFVHADASCWSPLTARLVPSFALMAEAPQQWI